MKPFKFACPACGKNYAIRKLEQVGRRMRCTGCQAVSTISRAPSAPFPVGEAPTLGREIVEQLSELTGLLESASAELSSFSVSAACTSGDGAGPGVVLAPAPTAVVGPLPNSRTRPMSDSLSAIDNLLKDMPNLAVREAIAGAAPEVTPEEVPAAKSESLEDLMAKLLAEAEPVAPAAAPLPKPPSAGEDLMAKLLAEAEPLPAVAVKPAAAAKPAPSQKPASARKPALSRPAAAGGPKYPRPNAPVAPARAAVREASLVKSRPSPAPAFPVVTSRARLGDSIPMAALADDEAEIGGDTMAAEPYAGDTIADTVEADALSPLEELGAAAAARVAVRPTRRRKWLVAGALAAFMLTIGLTVGLIVILRGDSVADVAAAVNP